MINIKINVPERLLDDPIEKISENNKLIWLLRRSGIHTINDLVDTLNVKDLTKLSGFGKIKSNSVKNALFNYIIENMTNEELMRFLMS